LAKIDYFSQGDHLPGKAGSVREFTESRKKSRLGKLFIANFMFGGCTNV